MSSQNCGPFPKVSGVLGLQEYFGPGYIEKNIENTNCKGSSTRKQTKGNPNLFYCLQSHFLELESVIKNLLTLKFFMRVFITY